MANHPKQLGPYEIRGVLGVGGMGVVYEGWDPRLNRRVAVKTLRAELGRNEEAKRLFLREARAVAAISHSHVTQIYDIGDEGQVVYFAMEYLDGASLRERLQQEGPLPLAEAIDWVQQAAHGLKAAADLGIIHRDIKPSNLVLNSDGRLKVTDFGLAKQMINDSSPSSSTTFIATADYLAPERASGDPADFRSDIYSLGATFYELITGRPPFKGATPVAVIAQHLREVPPHPQKFRENIPYPASALVLKMLAKQPESRPQTYQELAALLERLAASPLVQQSDSAQPSLSQNAVLTVESEQDSSSIGWPLKLGAAAIVALLVIGAWKMLGGTTDTPLASTLPQPQADSGRNAALDSALAAAADSPIQVLGASVSRHKAELLIIDNAHEFTDAGQLRVSGKVRNVGLGRAASGKVRVSYVDPDGNELAVETVPLMPPIVDPDQLSEFEVTLPVAAAAGKIAFELKWLS